MSKVDYPRIYKVPRQSFFLFGPRGVGKSTWAKRVLPKALRVDLLDESLYHSYLANPELFAAELRTLAPKSWVIVDEIQRIPDLLNQVHRFIEDRRLAFLLLGSSARKLKTAGTNLLAGRALKKLMYPLTPAELGKDFHLEEVLRFGGLPLVITSASKAETLKAYVELYLREEIKAEALVRNLASFLRFLPLAALFHGQTLNLSSLARDSETARTTIAGYIEMLEDTLLAYRLPAYEGKLRVRERKHPKLYWIDPGIVRAVKKQFHPVTIEERGPLLEGWIFTLLKTYNEIYELHDELYYWGPSEARETEVDFLLQRNQKFLAIEVKSNPKYSTSYITGLRAIAPLKGLQRRVLIYTGHKKLLSADGIEIWPVESFVHALEEDSLWP
ncbi:MAG: ATP-binding protein [Acidobacteria bacterium]|nr:ATP-binding protein [Acidobacteriota bacterium]